VRFEFSANKHVGCIFRTAILAAFMGILGSSALYAQKQKPNIPDPIKFDKKYDIVANVVCAVLGEMDLQIELEDRKGGKITTRPYEFITGSLTSSEVDKVAVKKDAPSDNWVKAQYSVEALLEIVSPSVTMVTIRTKMEALSRGFDGKEKWVPIDSLGTYEKRILGKISTKLLGNDAPAVNERKGFWGQSPQPVDSRQPRYPAAPSR
jgi:hypothetical protein